MTVTVFLQRRALLRFAELLFQTFDQLKQALGGHGVIDQDKRPLGLFQPPL